MSGKVAAGKAGRNHSYPSEFSVPFTDSGQMPAILDFFPGRLPEAQE
jgi:hypothetical protein